MSTESFDTAKSLILATPLPLATKSYSPVSHRQVIETTLECLDKAGIDVIHERYVSARKGQQINGIYDLKGGDQEMNFRLIFQNSYDKSLPLAVGMGNVVIVCRNGCVMGDMGALKRKHTGTVLEEFKEKIGMYIDTAGDLFEKMVDDRERMKNIEMTKQTSAELIGRMFLLENLITATQLGIIKKEIENPSYNYGTNNTLWNDYNNCTLSFRDNTHPSDHFKSHMNLHKFITKEYSLS